MRVFADESDRARLPVTVDAEILSGQPVFSGTRVPVDALLENLEAGLSLQGFLDNFPTVSRDQAICVLEFARKAMGSMGAAA